MTREEFYTIVEQENLDKYNIGDSIEISNAANVTGCINDNGKWVVYETNERCASYIIYEAVSESDGLEFLLAELRNKKKRDEIFKKLNK